MSHAMEDIGLARAWLAAIALPAVSLSLESVYEYIAAEIESRGPSCWASGRCCNFAKAGHRLYVTGLEAAYSVLHREMNKAPELTCETLARAIERGDCPFLRANLCGAHAIKPMGCRAYFCDRSAQQWQQDLSERAMDRIRRIHQEHGIAYRYGEWRTMLATFVM